MGNTLKALAAVAGTTIVVGTGVLMHSTGNPIKPIAARNNPLNLPVIDLQRADDVDVVNPDLAYAFQVSESLTGISNSANATIFVVSVTNLTGTNLLYMQSSDDAKTWKDYPSYEVPLIFTASNLVAFIRSDKQKQFYRGIKK